MIKKYGLLSSMLFYVLGVYAARVDTVSVYSTAMDKEIKNVVVLPDNYDQGSDFPVVYLLHGYGGNYADWVNKAPEIKALADQYSMMIVCPDGGRGSWYWDSPSDEKFQYETYVSTELVSWIDEHFKTNPFRESRAITGLSMGGHGALYLAFKHQDVFGAAGSTAGGVDIRPFPKNWEMENRLGPFSENSELWNENTVINMLHLLTPGSLEILIDCGTSDFFSQVNTELHQKMLYRNIKHTFVSQPGAHNWEYWQKTIPYQLMFMHSYFQRSEDLPKD